MESLVLLEWKSILWYLFCQQGAQFHQRCLCRLQKRGAWGVCSLCVCTCVFMCVTVSNVHLHVLFISHPVIHSRSLFQDSPASSFSQRFPPGNPLDFPHLSSMFKCTAIPSPQDSAKKWASLVVTPFGMTDCSRVLLCRGPFTARGPGPWYNRKAWSVWETGTAMEEQQEQVLPS